MAQGWGNAAPAIVSNQIAALLRAAGMAFLAWGLLMILPRDRGIWMRWRSRIAWAAVAVVMLDQLTVSRHYVQTVRAENVIGSNAVTDYLKSNLGSQRAYLVAQESFYNHWLTYLFPYHHIQTFNVTQIRMPPDYERFLSTVGRGAPDRLWRQFAVGQILGPSQAWQQLQNLAGFKGQLNLGMTYDVAQQGEGVAVVPASASKPGSQMIARITAPAPRYALIGGWQVAGDDQTLAALANPSQPLFETAFVAEGSGANLPASSGKGIIGKVDVASYRPGAVTLKTSAEQPAVLRASDRYTSFWKAFVDGKPAQLLRCDFLFQGVFLPAGNHEVVLKYAPPLTTLWIQFAGMGLCVLAALILIIQRLRSSPPPVAT
jgi:hypothetical protein